MKKKIKSESARSTENFLNVDKQDISNSKHSKHEFLNSERINKIKQGIIGDTEYITDNSLVDLLNDDGPELFK